MANAHDVVCYICQEPGPISCCPVTRCPACEGQGEVLGDSCEWCWLGGGVDGVPFDEADPELRGTGWCRLGDVRPAKRERVARLRELAEDRGAYGVESATGWPL